MVVLAAFALLGCDQGAQTNEPYNRGAPVHLVAANVGVNTPLPSGQPIELAFDRLLLPITVTRQTFTLVDQAAPMTGLLFTIAYDPVARVVTISPLTALGANHSYVLTLNSPADPTDPNGLHAIDGATMDPNTTAFPRSITFPVVAAAATPPTMCGPVVGPCVDFCTSIAPILQNDCISGSCHSAAGGSPAAGLQVSPMPGPSLLATAIGRLAVGSSMGALSLNHGAPSAHFPQDMPIIDAVSSLPDAPMTTGDPGNSYMIYKLLMAGTAGTFLELRPTPPYPPLGTVYSLTWPGGMPGVAPALSDSERATLASLVPGREMPMAGTNDFTPNLKGLTVDTLEKFSLWIAQGAPLAESCP